MSTVWTWKMCGMDTWKQQKKSPQKQKRWLPQVSVNRCEPCFGLTWVRCSFPWQIKEVWILWLTLKKWSRFTFTHEWPDQLPVTFKFVAVMKDMSLHQFKSISTHSEHPGQSTQVTQRATATSASTRIRPNLHDNVTKYFRLIRRQKGYKSNLKTNLKHLLNQQAASGKNKNILN